MVLVTGGTGFLGAYIISNLVAKGHRVRAIRRNIPLPAYIPATVLEQVNWVEGDVLDLVSLQDAMEGVDALVHAAAVVSFHDEDRRRMYQVNDEGTANVINTAIDAGVKRMVHVSSVAALGRTTTKEMVNEDKKWQVNKNNTHYAISKHKAEMHAWRGIAEGLEGVIVNPSTILGYGNWQQSSNAIFRNAFKGFKWYTHGLNGFVGVEDVAEAVVRLLESSINEKRFVVSAENRPFRDLFNTIADGFHKPRPSREASRYMGEIAWRLEAIKSGLTGSRPLLTKETAKIAQSQTSFDGTALVKALPGFHYTPLEEVIKKACEKYTLALNGGLLTL